MGTCQQNCYANPYCSAWQDVPAGISGTGCYQGMRGGGYACNSGRGGFEAIPSERLQHGNVQVLANVTKYRVDSLKFRFDLEQYATLPEVIQNCREVCYSDITCQ